MNVRKRLTYANVMATVAVFVALGGGAYAITLGKDSVRSKQIKNGSVKSADVADNGLIGTDIDERTLQIPDGPTGPRGPKGDTGNPGVPGASNLEIVAATSALTASQSPKSATASCPDGKSLIGSGGSLGGAFSTGSSPDARGEIEITEINPDATSVRVEAFESDGIGASWTVTAEAICANVG